MPEGDPLRYITQAAQNAPNSHRFTCSRSSYARKDQAETSVLFELIAERYERKSLLITANQPFSGWNAVFPDPGMTVAAIDRLVHHSTIFELNVESYRRRKAGDKQNARRRQLNDDNPFSSQLPEDGNVTQ